jgi:hypothetical protein
MSSRLLSDSVHHNELSLIIAEKKLIQWITVIHLDDMRHFLNWMLVHSVRVKSAIKQQVEIFSARNSAWSRRSLMDTFALISFLFVCAPLTSCAAIYLNDAVIDKPENTFIGGNPPNDAYDSVFLLTQSPNGFVLLEVKRVGMTTAPYEFQFNRLAIAGYYGLFSVSSGEELTFLNAATKPSGFSLAITSGQSAYIGYWSQRGGKPSSPTMEADDIFGWAKVTVVAPSGPNSARLTVLESVSADGGIIVGTAIQIPETSSIILALMGSSLLLLRRRLAA